MLWCKSVFNLMFFMSYWGKTFGVVKDEWPQLWLLIFEKKSLQSPHIQWWRQTWLECEHGWWSVSIKKNKKKHSTTTSSSTWSLQSWLPHSYILILNSDLILNSIGFNSSSKVRNKSAFRNVETDVKVLRMLTEEHVYKHF